MVYERLILFTSYYFATKMESLAQKAGFSVQLIATPATLSHACGMCIVCGEKEIKGLVQLMKEKGISHSGIYQFKGLREPVIKLSNEEV